MQKYILEMKTNKKQQKVIHPKSGDNYIYIYI